MSIPVKGFIFTNGGRIIHPDITLRGFLSTVKDGQNISLNLLRKRKVFCADEDHNKVFRAWSIYKCIYAEVELDSQKYILNNGSWFRVDTNFVQKTNENFDKIPTSDLELPEYCGEGEGKYNESVAAADAERFTLLDNKKIMHGGGQGQVEVCDLLSIDRQLIHVKRYGRSNVFSHLFAQGYVSGRLLQLDAEFRKKVREKLSPSFAKLIDVENRPADGQYTIIYAVISESKKEKLHLPFFSRVNLNNVEKTLRGFGYKVELLKVPVNSNYSKTKVAPPGKTKKL